MKPKIILVSILFLQQIVCSAQFKFKNDYDFRYYSESLIKFANIQSPNFVQMDFEMRLYLIQFTSRPHLLYIFQHARDGRWFIKKFEFCTTDWQVFKDLKNDSLMPSNLWGLRWDSLIQKGLFKLPTENRVKKKWKSSRGIFPAIADGVSYRLELLTQKNKRRFSYTNPQAKLPYFDLHNDELITINEIIGILNKELKFMDAKDTESPCAP